MNPLQQARERFEKELHAQLDGEMGAAIAEKVVIKYILRAFSEYETTLREILAAEVEKRTVDEFSGYGEIERRIVNATLEGAANIIKSKYL